jgi:hypothetical protein
MTVNESDSKINTANDKEETVDRVEYRAPQIQNWGETLSTNQGNINHEMMIYLFCFSKASSHLAVIDSIKIGRRSGRHTPYIRRTSG